MDTSRVRHNLAGDIIPSMCQESCRRIQAIKINVTSLIKIYQHLQAISNTQEESGLLKATNAKHGLDINVHM